WRGFVRLRRLAWRILRRRAGLRVAPRRSLWSSLGCAVLRSIRGSLVLARLLILRHPRRQRYREHRRKKIGCESESHLYTFRVKTASGTSSEEAGRVSASGKRRRKVVPFPSCETKSTDP